MAQDPNNLIWLDMEMTGLDPDRDRVIDAAAMQDARIATIEGSGHALMAEYPDAVLDALRSFIAS